VHATVDTLGHLLALGGTIADDQDRAQIGLLAKEVKAVTGENVTLADVNQGITGTTAARAAQIHGIALSVVKLATPTMGFFCCPDTGSSNALQTGPLTSENQRVTTSLSPLLSPVSTARLCLPASSHAPKFYPFRFMTASWDAKVLLELESWAGPELE